MRAFHPELPEDPVPGRRADLWVTVFVDEAYLAPAARPPGRPTRPGVCLPA